MRLQPGNQLGGEEGVGEAGVGAARAAGQADALPTSPMQSQAKVEGGLAQPQARLPGGQQQQQGERGREGEQVPRTRALLEQPWLQRVLWQAPGAVQGGPAAAAAALACLSPAWRWPNSRLPPTPGAPVSWLGGGVGDTAGPGAGAMAGLAWLRPAAVLPPHLVTPLLLDLSDPRMVFAARDPTGLQHAAALVRPAAPHVPVKHGLPIVDGDEVALELSRYNVSQDAVYGLGAGVRKARVGPRGLGADITDQIVHADPAATLLTLPVKMDAVEEACFHRPRGRWHPRDLQLSGPRLAKLLAAALVGAPLPDPAPASKPGAKPDAVSAIPPATAAAAAAAAAAGTAAGEDAAAGGKVEAGGEGAGARGLADSAGGERGDKQALALVKAGEQALVSLSVQGLTGRVLRFDVPPDFLGKTLGEVLSAPDVKFAARFPAAANLPHELWLVGPPTCKQLHLQEPLAAQGLTAVSGKEARANLMAVVFNDVQVSTDEPASPIALHRRMRDESRLTCLAETKAQLTAAEGHVVLAEYLEEWPPLLARPGMSLKLTTWYKKKSDDDTVPRDLDAALTAVASETAAAAAATTVLPDGRVASVQPAVALGPEDDSPFVGPLQPGSAQLAVEGMMFRAPAAAHTPQHTDFLLLRSAAGVLSLRELNGSLLVGQQHPLQRVPDPEDSEALGLLRSRALVQAVRHLSRLQAVDKRKAKRGGMEAERAAGLKLAELEAQFPSVKDLRSLLQDNGCVQRAGTGTATSPAVFDLADNVPPLPESELRKLVTPDAWAAYESGRAAEARVKASGLSQVRYLAGVEPPLVKMALDMLPLSEPGWLDAVERVEHLLAAGVTWLTTDAFIQCMKEGRIVLDMINPAGDPTGASSAAWGCTDTQRRGHGFACVRRLEVRSDGSAPSRAPEVGTITGTDTDLRKLSTKEAAQILRDFGVKEETIATCKD
ncbi:hypothetical protein QJQ45_015959, partial [Haematococcus lacustris]